jgi:hypothetical protein
MKNYYELDEKLYEKLLWIRWKIIMI